MVEIRQKEVIKAAEDPVVEAAVIFRELCSIPSLLSRCYYLAAAFTFFFDVITMQQLGTSHEMLKSNNIHRSS
ncbi:hypothetical protein TNCT_610181 [Trichonephila clavata]|uniref:Uncharacterized protein n=1 Tax=Trichonephila clavata TaxID=2740835 RepID=A0A8X6H6N1_TRICU|nr:hypothetical protein TNCT_610181 [Trichonephila clavata]